MSHPGQSLVPMAMVTVRSVGVNMAQSDVDMRMRVRFADRIARVVTMLVMLVMDMAMIVLDRFMLMLVSMAFREVEPHADSHEEA